LPQNQSALRQPKFRIWNRPRRRARPRCIGDSGTAKRPMELICSVSLIAKRSGFSRTRTTPQIWNLLKGQRGTGQIREKAKEDENGIGIADARSLSSEAGEGAGVANKKSVL
jgi:hypothetical protein